MSGRGAEAGFTLLEILVALVVLGFLLVGLSEGVRFGLHAWNSETKLVDRGADFDGAERVLRNLITDADPGDINQQAPMHGKPHTLAFVAPLPLAAGGMVTRTADIALGVDTKHRLVLRWTLHPHAQRLTSPEPAQQTVLLEGVDHVAFSYERGTDQGGGWVDTWEAPVLPLLVRITLGFPEGDRRHWPTIEVAPMLSRAEQ